MNILDKLNEFLADEIGDFMPRVFNGRVPDHDVVDTCPQCNTSLSLKKYLKNSPFNPDEDEDPLKDPKAKKKKLSLIKKTRLYMEKETV